MSSIASMASSSVNSSNLSASCSKKTRSSSSASCTRKPARPVAQSDGSGDTSQGVV
eukprot:CAMPEP_0119063384 /NCGR_PEP_ID=MMETSP1178-20130426/6745_1 /TAXON_ID=33656 /ORGANISM="unid sp, Strain CCMP2000" /LENGTH=55 /DNA_ID=CAMNT_0007044751 /DNA_START=55 /DNA_END=219 /DNA_ORIENTATION=+